MKDSWGLAEMGGTPSFVGMSLRHPWWDAAAMQFLGNALGPPSDARSRSYLYSSGTLLPSSGEIVTVDGVRWVVLVSEE